MPDIVTAKKWRVYRRRRIWTLHKTWNIAASAATQGHNADKKVRQDGNIFFISSSNTDAQSMIYWELVLYWELLASISLKISSEHILPYAWIHMCGYREKWGTQIQIMFFELSIHQRILKQRIMVSTKILSITTTVVNIWSGSKNVIKVVLKNGYCFCFRTTLMKGFDQFQMLLYFQHW